MSKAVVVFTNNVSLKGINIDQSIPFPKQIIVSKDLSLYLLSDSSSSPNLEFSKNFDEIYVIFHTNGKTEKKYIKKELGNKLKGDKILSHLNNSKNYYSKQLRRVLEQVTVNSDALQPWSISEDSSIADEYLLEPFDDGGIETKLTLLNKLLCGSFDQLNEEEKSVLTKNQFNLEKFQQLHKQDNFNWQSFKNLRDKLTINL